MKIIVAIIVSIAIVVSFVAGKFKGDNDLFAMCLNKSGSIYETVIIGDKATGYIACKPASEEQIRFYEKTR